MNGKYIVEMKAYSKTYGVVMTRKVFKGEQKAAYEKAMIDAYKKANRCQAKSHDFTVTIKGENWRTASTINP